MTDKTDEVPENHPNQMTIDEMLADLMGDGTATVALSAAMKKRVQAIADEVLKKAFWKNIRRVVALVLILLATGAVFTVSMVAAYNEEWAKAVFMLVVAKGILSVSRAFAPTK